MFYGKNREINHKLSLSPLCTWSYNGGNYVCQKSLISTQHIFISGLHCDVCLPFLQRQTRGPRGPESLSIQAKSQTFNFEI